MITTTLSLDQILALSVELEGNQHLKGLMSYKLPFKTKYHLNQLLNTINPMVEFVKAESDKLVKEMGTIENDNLFIKETSPEFKIYWEKMQEITSVTQEISHYPFTFDDFSTCELDGYFRHIFLLIKS
jgi:hypothetical protein